ncbi:nuclear transport factor 2 family protein [Nocardia sp. NPDC050175]|uniref:nuclear transport factor 2 family protein n=1 Tax=Nocardia sp. NPDC050175 TaxID=3364317 RepID=UPI0037B11F3C
MTSVTMAANEDLAGLIAVMSARLRRLEDIEQIQALHRSYVRYLADRRWDDMLELFTDDVVVDLGHDGVRRGREQVVELFGLIESRGNPHAGYVLSSPVIEVTADSATGVWTLHRHSCEFIEMGATVRVYGRWTEARYNCGYRRIGEEWQISRLQARVVLPDPQPVSGTDAAAEPQ